MYPDSVEIEPLVEAILAGVLPLLCRLSNNAAVGGTRSSAFHFPV